MKIAVRYYTKTGNTKRLAEAVAQAVGVEALPISSPVTEQVDVLFLGNSYYAFSIDPEVRSFIRSLDKSMIGKIVNFGSAAMLNSTYKKVKAEADKVGVPMETREFHCRGEFKGVHKGKPDAEDLKAALDKVSAQLAEERRSYEHAASLRARAVRLWSSNTGVLPTFTLCWMRR